MAEQSALNKASTDTDIDINAPVEELFTSYSTVTLDGINHAYGIDIPCEQARALIAHKQSFYRAFLTPATRQIYNNRLVSVACELENIANDYFIEIKESDGFIQSSDNLYEKIKSCEQQFIDINNVLSTTITTHTTNEQVVMALGKTLTEWNQLQDQHVNDLRRLMNAGQETDTISAEELRNEADKLLAEYDNAKGGKTDINAEDALPPDEDDGGESGLPIDDGFPEPEVTFLLGLHHYNNIEELTQKVLSVLAGAYDKDTISKELRSILVEKLKQYEQQNSEYIERNYKQLVEENLTPTADEIKKVIASLNDFNERLRELRKETLIFDYDPKEVESIELTETLQLD